MYRWVSAWGAFDGGWRRHSQPRAFLPSPFSLIADTPAGVGRREDNEGSYQIWLLVERIDQALSSDNNRVGDAFSTTLTQPVVVHGMVATSRGRDAAAIAGARAVGAAIGAAAIGAGAGAVAGTVGVLLTRGYPTVVYPEALLTFQPAAPVPVNTDYTPEAFLAVTAADYAETQPPRQAPPVVRKNMYAPNSNRR